MCEHVDYFKLFHLALQGSTSTSSSSNYHNVSLFNLPPKQNFKWMSSFKMCLDIVYFAKNWKNCNKIIFKRVNSAVESIFNKSFTEKKKFMGPVNSA